MSTTGDQRLRATGALYMNKGKRPYIYFGDCMLGTGLYGGYINNSLEGTIFDADDGTTGQVIINGANVTPNFGFYDYGGGGGSAWSVSAISITSGVCSMKANSTTDYEIGDIVAVTGVAWDSTHPNVNGSWVVTSVSTTNYLNDTFTFNINAADVSIADPGLVIKGSVFRILDNRQLLEARGQSFTSILFTPVPIYNVGVGYKRILPSDLYTRFRIQSASDVVPQGGINSNLFNVLDTAGVNIKPVLWAYFFGYNDSTISTRPAANQFEIAFNSYAIVLRPSGSGSTLEFALVKFNWGLDTEAWAGNIVGQSHFKSYDVPGSNLGYLISSNPAVGTNKVSEIAKSDSFTYNAEFPVKLNLKITIRKHLLSDSALDGTYLVNLMINDDYDDFGESAHYDSILHGYIPKPNPVSLVTDGTHPHDCMLMPLMYFKFNNTNEQNVGVPIFVSSQGSSKIIQDSLMFRQLNSLTTTSYLY